MSSNLHLTLCRSLNEWDIVRDDLATDRIKISSDIDSFLISCTTLDPYKCEKRFQILLGDVFVFETQNVKFTRYLQNRHKFFPNINHNFAEDDPYVIIKSESIDPTTKFYEFLLGSVDDLAIYCVFQYDETSVFFANNNSALAGPTKTPLGLVRLAFLNQFILAAAKNLPPLCQSARTGVTIATSSVKDKFNIFAIDWPRYTKLVTEALRVASYNLSEMCGMTYVRFVVCQHGLRATKPAAEQFFYSLVNVSHPHVNVVQVHKADELEPPEDTAVLACVDLKKLRDVTVRNAYAKPYHGKVTTFKLGLMHRFGAFYSYSVFLHNDNAITYIQVYNSAAKMSRVEPLGFLPLYLLLHCFNSDTQDSTFQKLATTVRYKLQTLTHFVQTFCARRVILRLEEVMTFDVQRQFDIETAIQRARLFNVEQPTLLYYLLLDTGCLYQFQNWIAHSYKYIGEELAFVDYLSNPDLDITSGQFPCVPRLFLRTAVRAIYTLYYFAHGHDPDLNYNLVQSMYTGSNEGESLDLACEVILLKKYHDDNDENAADEANFPCPFYNNLFPAEWTAVATFLYTVDIVLPTFDATDLTRYILQLYATWSYVMFFLQPTARPALTNFPPMLQPNALSLNIFLQKFAYQRENISQSPVHFATKSVTADMLVNSVLEEPKTAFGILLRRSINIPPEMVDDVKNALCSQIRAANVQVFPHKLIFPGHEKNIYTWMIVTSETSDKQLLQKAKQNLKIIRSRVNKLIKSRKSFRVQRVIPLSVRPQQQVTPTQAQQQQEQRSATTHEREEKKEEEEVGTTMVVRATVHAVSDNQQITPPVSAHIALPPRRSSASLPQEDLDQIVPFSEYFFKEF